MSQATKVEQYLGASGRFPRDLPAMYVKTAVILAWLMGSYVWLVFAADSVGGAALRSHVRWLKRMGRPALGGAV